jgi:hypothetical protein
MNLQRIARLVNKNELAINEVVLDHAQKNEQIIYGARAYNSQSPGYLKKKTYDYDVLTKKPKHSANAVAEILARRLGRKTEVVKGTHKGTYRIKIDDEPIVDYTQIRSKPKTKKIWGNSYRDLKSIKRNATRLSNNPKMEYRKEKDLDTLAKIREIERIDNMF